MDDEDEEDTLLCGSKGQITLDEQHRYIRAKQQVDASDAECEKYGMLLDETHQQLWWCRERLQALSSRRDQTAAQARHAARAGRHASLGYLRDRLAGLEMNMAHQRQHRHRLAHRLTALEKQSAAAAFDDGKLVSTKFFVNEMEKDFEQRKQAQKSCYIQREEKLAKIYQDSVVQRDERSRRTLLSLASREDQLRRQAEEAVASMDRHVAGTVRTLRRRQKQQLLTSERQRQSRSDAVRQFARQLEYTREVLRVQQQQQQQQQQETSAHSAGQVPDEPRAVPASAQKLQAHLERRRATLAAAEQSRLALAARQRDNTRRIVTRLVQEERRRLQSSGSPAPAPALQPRRPGDLSSAGTTKYPPSCAAAPGVGVGAGVRVGAGAGVGATVDGPAAELDDNEDNPPSSSERESSGSSSPPGEPADGILGRASRLSAGDLERLQRLMETSAGGVGGEGDGGSAEDGESDEELMDVGKRWGVRKPDMMVERPPVTSEPCPFSWKPDVIEFRDFQVGWTYRRRVSIVNLSRSRSSCRFIGLFEPDYYQLQQPLADCLRVHFQPPGFLGTGLSARLDLEFTPRVLCDGECLVRFQAPNGEFQVPVRFVAQRCEPRLDRNSVEFGEMVLGARLRRSVMLRNTGSKGCRFTFRTVTVEGIEREREEEEREEEGQGGVTAVDTQAKARHGTHEMPHGETEDVVSSDAAPTASTTATTTAGSATTATTTATVATRIVSSILYQLLDRLPIIDFDGGLGVCGCAEGELPAGGRARLHIGCVADLEGVWRQRFVVEFDDPNCEPLTLTASYSGHAFPISVRNPHLSLDICLCGLTYWDTFEIVNTGKVASVVRTVVPDDMKPYVEIQGSPALVQADNSFKVKIFFKPKRSLLNPPHRFFDPATHVLDFPVSFHVDSGSSPGDSRGDSISGSVQAAVSSNRVWLRPERLEFGRVTLLESVCRRVHLTNGGLTMQQCHFTGLPDSVTVQPGNGGAFLLPGETIPLDVIFSPSAAGQQLFSLVVETLDGGRASISCRGLATTPPLSLSATSIKMSGIPVQGQMRSAVYVQCPKVSLAEEKLFASGGSFEFQPPDGIPVAIHPMVGFVPYKQSRRVEVMVTPDLDPAEVRITASLLRYERLEMEQAAQQEQSAKLDKNKKKPKKKSADTHQLILCPEPSTIETGSAIYREAQQVLLKTCDPTTQRYVIPCCVRHGSPDQENSGSCDVLYLEVVCSTASPHLLPSSPLCLEFGPRVLHSTAYLDVTLEGAAEGPLRPITSALDPHGPFRLVDPLREVRPGESRTVRVSFTPQRISQELEFWTISGGNASLRYTLYGRGVKPQFTVLPEDGALNMGKAKPGKTAKKQILVTNQCDAPLEFTVDLLPAPPLLPVETDARSRGSGSARRRREPEPAVWGFSVPLLAVEPGRSAALEVQLTPAEEALYEAQVVLRLFRRLDEVVVTATGKTPGYKAPKSEKGGKKSAEKGGKGKKK